MEDYSVKERFLKVILFLIIALPIVILSIGAMAKQPEEKTAIETETKKEASMSNFTIKPKTQRESAMGQPYYIEKNTERYEQYKEKHEELSYEQVMMLVNSDVDIAHYTKIKTIENPADKLVLCNKNNKLPNDFVPKLGTYKGQMLEVTALEAYKKMESALNKTGYSLHIRSGYRSYATQKYLYGSYVKTDGVSGADTSSARAGHSEHQTGLAIDIIQPGISSSTTLYTANFQNTKQYAWLQEHAHEYGFILRYPKDKSDITGYIYEPWHYRYVGIDAAKIIWQEGITFEEYYGQHVVKK